MHTAADKRRSPTCFVFYNSLHNSNALLQLCNKNTIHKPEAIRDIKFPLKTMLLFAEYKGLKQ